MSPQRLGEVSFRPGGGDLSGRKNGRGHRCGGGFIEREGGGTPKISSPNTYKFVRTYTVIDWCDPSDVRTFTQVVKVGDTQASTFSGPTQDRDFDGVIDGDLIFSTNAGNQCAAFIVLDGPGVAATDNCEGDITVVARIFPGTDLTAAPIGPFDVDLTDGNAEVTSSIPVGTHTLRYTYTDVCGNSDFEDFDFTVEDGTAPVAICEDGLNISITAGSAGGGASTGIAILTPDMIDAGSYDDCSGITLEIARVNASNIATEAYDQELVLSCADLGIVRVGLKVTDALGNMNFCWLDVLVEDKNIPTCIPPGPVALTCVEYLAAGLPADIGEATQEELDALFGSAVGDMAMMVMTADNGSYTFGALPENVDYTVQPNYNVGVNLSNVTVADVNLVGNVVADFVGYELGNVNAANRASAAIEVEDAKLEAGQTHTMVLSGAELLGFQGTLELAAGLELVDVTYEGEGGLNLNGAANGIVTMMFLADATVSVVVRATEAGNLSDLVSLTSGVTVAEGVNLTGTAGPLSLEFTTAPTELFNSLEQNAPNPVADVTKIGFTLAQAGEVTLTIQDVVGRTVSVRELTGTAGRNVVELNVADFGGATGMLSYTLVAGEFTATKKMVVVR